MCLTKQWLCIYSSYAADSNVSSCGWQVMSFMTLQCWVLKWQICIKNNLSSSPLHKVLKHVNCHHLNYLLTFCFIYYFCQLAAVFSCKFFKFTINILSQYWYTNVSNSKRTHRRFSKSNKIVSSENHLVFCFGLVFFAWNASSQLLNMCEGLCFGVRVQLLASVLHGHKILDLFFKKTLLKAAPQLSPTENTWKIEAW